MDHSIWFGRGDEFMFEQVDQQVHGKQQHSLLLLLNFSLFKLFVYERVCGVFFVVYVVLVCVF